MKTKNQPPVRPLISASQSALLAAILPATHEWHDHMIHLANGCPAWQRPALWRAVNDLETELDDLWAQRRQQLATAHARQPLPAGHDRTQQPRDEVYQMHVAPVC